MMKSNFIKYGIACILSLLSVPSAVAGEVGKKATSDKTLYLTVEITPEKVVMHAVFGGNIKSYTISEEPKQVSLDFGELYKKLEKVKATKAQVDKLLGRYDKSFYEPVADFVNSAEEVQFIIDEQSISYAFDLINFNGKPLFLQKPITFSTGKQAPKEIAFFKTWSGLAVSDRTADPDYGVKFLKTILPDTEYFNMKELDLKQFKSIKPKNVTLLSLHGALEKRGANMDLNNSCIFAKDVARLRSTIVYLDSCQMGASYEFLTTLRDNGNDFYVAPLVSNEAGDSSTKTILHFFNHLSEGDSPAVAMFKAKTQLYNLYHGKKYQRVLEKVFPFRVYRQNNKR